MITKKRILVSSYVLFVSVILLNSPCNCMEMSIEDIQNLLVSENACENVRAFLANGVDPNTITRRPEDPALQMPSISFLELALISGKIDVLRILLADPRTNAQVRPTFFPSQGANLLNLAASNMMLQIWEQIPQGFAGIQNNVERQEQAVLALLRAGVDYHQAVAAAPNLAPATARIGQLVIDWDDYETTRQQLISFFQASHSRLGANSTAHRLNQHLFDYIVQYVVRPDKDDSIDTIHAKAEAYRAMRQQ